MPRRGRCSGLQQWQSMALLSPLRSWVSSFSFSWLSCLSKLQGRRSEQLLSLPSLNSMVVTLLCSGAACPFPSSCFPFILCSLRPGWQFWLECSAYLWQWYYLETDRACGSMGWEKAGLLSSRSFSYLGYSLVMRVSNCPISYLSLISQIP